MRLTAFVLNQNELSNEVIAVHRYNATLFLQHVWPHLWIIAHGHHLLMDTAEEEHNWIEIGPKTLITLNHWDYSLKSKMQWHYKQNVFIAGPNNPPAQVVMWVGWTDYCLIWDKQWDDQKGRKY